MTKETRNIQIVPHDLNWPKQFEIEAGQINKALGDNCVAIHHVGSTFAT